MNLTGKDKACIILILIMIAFLFGVLFGSQKMQRFGDMVCQRYEGVNCIFTGFEDEGAVRSYGCLCPINEPREVIMVSGGN